MDEKALRREGRTKLLLAVFVLLAVIVAEVVGLIVVLLLNLGLTSLESTLITELAGCIAVVTGFLLISGRASWALTSREDLALTLRYGWWILVVAVAFMGFELVDLSKGSSSIVPDWPQKVALTATLCLVIGLFEEFMFRGIIFGGLLAVMGGTHKGVMRAIMLTSLFFGAMHVSFTEDFTDALSVAQAVLKIVQTGVYSIVMCAIVLRSKRLVGASLLHGFDDFLLVMPSVALHGESLSTDYVLEGEQGLEVIVTYVIVIALYLPVAVKCLRDLHRMQLTTRGPLMEVAEIRFAAAQAQRADGAAMPLAPTTAYVQEPWSHVPVRPYGEVSGEVGNRPWEPTPTAPDAPMPATTNAWMSAAPTASAPLVPQTTEAAAPVPTPTAPVPDVPAGPAPAATYASPRRRDGRGSGRPPIPRGLE